MSPVARGAILAIDQGTSLSKAALFTATGRLLGSGRAPVTTKFGAGGAADQDPAQILASTRLAIRRAMSAAGRPRIAAAGIAAQRSTFVLWDRATGRAIGPAPTWQSTVAYDVCARLGEHDAVIRQRTGLPLSPHYSASKLSRLLASRPELMRRAERGDLLFGNVATWILWNFTGGKVHATEPTHAARTLLFNIETLAWDPWLLDLFRVPREILPEVRPSLGSFGDLAVGGLKIPVTACLGDQQAALAGAVGLRSGRNGGIALANYGTGAFLLIPTGERPLRRDGLLTSLAWTSGKSRRYLLEGTINAAGTTLEWLHDDLAAPGDLKTIDRLCRDASGQTLLLPAFRGLGSAYADLSDANLPSLAVNLGPGGTIPDLTRAAVEAIAHLGAVILERASGRPPVKRLVATGSLSGLKYLLEFQSALLQGVTVERSVQTEATLAGIARAAAPDATATRRRRPRRRSVAVTVPRGLRATAQHRHREWRRLIALARIWKEVAEAYP